jgi:exo-beta-1,3-glucanase (GH17 family)
MRAAASAWLLLAGLCSACVSRPPGPPPAVASPEARFAPRPLRPFLGDRWIGQGISYGPHRDGQRPGGASPTRAQLREDLELLKGRWGLLRLYQSDGPSPDVLALIREERLPFKVLLGAWIAPETGPAAGGAPPAPLPEARAANRAQVEDAVRLANAYPDVVLALCVGNETQVSWSAHRLPAETLIGWLREARRGTSVPVATADDFGFWLLPESDRVAREVDFIVTHVYAMWNGKPLEGALAFTQEKYAEVARRHPGLPVLLGEAGWATRKHVEGEQATLIKAEPGEGPQRTFYDQFTAWVVGQRIPSTWFEAFDENWKGGPHPDEVEKHWGLFRADRTPKQAVQAPPAAGR